MPGLRIHHVRLDANEVHLGATTQQRWAWELEDGAASAVNATDLVWVTITRAPPGQASAETIGLFPGRGSPERDAALAAIPALLEAAWRVLDAGWDARRAHDELTVSCSSVSATARRRWPRRVAALPSPNPGSVASRGELGRSVS